MNCHQIKAKKTWRKQTNFTIFGAFYGRNSQTYPQKNVKFGMAGMIFPNFMIMCQMYVAYRKKLKK